MKVKYRDCEIEVTRENLDKDEEVISYSIVGKDGLIIDADYFFKEDDFGLAECFSHTKWIVDEFIDNPDNYYDNFIKDRWDCELKEDDELYTKCYKCKERENCFNNYFEDLLG